MRTTFSVTPIGTAAGDGPQFSVTWFDEPTGSAVGYARYDLPLNGEWSDVTASFDILETPEGALPPEPSPHKIPQIPLNAA